MQLQTKSEKRIFYTMAITGGFMGGYAVFGSGILGSAQTINLIDLVYGIVGRDWLHVAIRIGAALIYALAIVLATLTECSKQLDRRLTALAVDALCVLLLFFMPHDLDKVISLYPVFFMMAFQWYSFPGACGYTSSSVFSTNNYRQAVSGLTKYFAAHDADALKKAGFFAGTLLFFHIGVAAAFLGTMKWSFAAVLLCLIPILAAYLFIRTEKNAAKIAFKN